jgi:hypothetical protein
VWSICGLTFLNGGLEKLFELVNGQPSITGYAAHCKGVDWIVSWNCEDPNSVSHHNVLSLTNNAKACFLQGPNSIEMVDAGYLGHG